MTDRIDHTGDSRQPGATRRRQRFSLRLLAGVLLVGAIFLLACLWPSQPLEQRIAAVNASHAPAPEKNAATVYDQLVPIQVLTGSPANFRLSPDAIVALIEASKIESCWFPLSPGEGCYRDHRRRINAIHDWARAMTNVVGEDVARDDLDAAAEKLRGILRMGGHLRQQALLLDFGVGCDMELRAWMCLRDLVMRPDASGRLLDMAQALPAELANDSEQAFKLIREVQPLIAATVTAPWGLRQRAQNWWRRFRGKFSEDEILQRSYLRLLSLRRGVRVLVGLQRYHDDTGGWPQSLDEIQTLVPAQVLIDPCTGQLLVYRRTEDGFSLYSKGMNKIDDNGARAANGPDDWRIWPP